MDRSLLLKTTLFALLSAAASIGIVVLLSDYLALSPWIAMPVSALAITASLLVFDRKAMERGYRSGVANAQVDSTTRLPASAVGQQVLTLEFAAAERGRALVVVLFNIENFRRLAPLEGGAAGKRLMVGIGAIMRRRTRHMHLTAGRGDEGGFISILTDSEIKGALVFANRVRNDLQKLSVGTQRLVVNVTMTEYEPAMRSVDDLLAAARPIDSLQTTRTRDADLNEV